MSDLTPPLVYNVADHAVAPHVLNTVRGPVLRLPIGTSAQVVGGPVSDLLFRVWVPSRVGGTLTLTSSKPARLKLQRPRGNTIAQADNEVVFQVPRGGHGDYFLLVPASLPTVSCRFQQVGLARDGLSDTAPPLIPWHFYFWPTPDVISDPGGVPYTNPYAQQARDILDKYTRAIGLPGPDDDTKYQQAGKWERNHHGRAVGYGWEGHCNHMAGASALFEQPADNAHKSARFGGQTFTQDDLELLAGEWFGNYGVIKEAWKLPGDDSSMAHPLPYYFKPAGPKDRQTLLKAFLECEPYHAAKAHELVAAAVQANGGDAAFGAEMDKLFGRAAAGFYGALADKLGDQHHPLIANMRDYSGSGGPDEVWNQVYFHYRADFHEEKHDERRLNIRCKLYANVDVTPRHGELPTTWSGPATVSGNDIVLASSLLEFRNEWVVHFHGGGKPDSGRENRWKSLQNEHGQELYAPDDMMILDKPSDFRRREPDPRDTGNPYVGKELVRRKLVSIRKRYR